MRQEHKLCANVVLMQVILLSHSKHRYVERNTFSVDKKVCVSFCLFCGCSWLPAVFETKGRSGASPRNRELKQRKSNLRATPQHNVRHCPAGQQTNIIESSRDCDVRQWLQYFQFLVCTPPQLCKAPFAEHIICEAIDTLEWVNNLL